MARVPERVLGSAMRAEPFGSLIRRPIAKIDGGRKLLTTLFTAEHIAVERLLLTGDIDPTVLAEDLQIAHGGNSTGAVRHLFGALIA